MLKISEVGSEEGGSSPILLNAANEMPLRLFER